MGSLNHIIVTCRPGNEELCEEEIGNALFEIDPNIVIEKTRFKGVLIVRSKEDLNRLFRRIKSGEYGFVERVVPLQIIVSKNVDEIVDKAIKLLPDKISEVCLKITIRGIRGLSSRIWSSLRKALLSRGIRVVKDAKYCIYVESVGDLIGVSFLEKNSDRVHASRLF